MPWAIAAAALAFGLACAGLGEWNDGNVRFGVGLVVVAIVLALAAYALVVVLPPDNA